MSLRAKIFMLEKVLLNHLFWQISVNGLQHHVSYLSAYKEFQWKSRKHVKTEAETRNIDDGIILKLLDC
jgi:hypothetical protein